MKEENIVTKEELKEISKFTRREMKPEEIYTFSVILCDNEIDRDMEKFNIDALNKISELFVGKTGIFDHSMSSKNQTARIYSASVMQDPARKTADGEIYTYVKAKAYMVKTEQNKELRKEIDAGIKKETSVSCSVKNIRCSICGRDIKNEGCEHLKGKFYEGKQCFYELCAPEDAYEWSFVAVPAQKNAGVTKAYNPNDNNMDILIYREDMKASVIKNGAKILPSLTENELIKICDKLPIKSLRAIKNALEAETAKNLPIVSQLAVVSIKQEENNDDYII